MADQHDIDAIQKDAERYRFLKENYLAADFDWQGACVLVFEIPQSTQVGADCDATIDHAIAAGTEDKP